MTVDIEQIIPLLSGVITGFVALITIGVALYMLEI